MIPATRTQGDLPEVHTCGPVTLARGETPHAQSLDSTSETRTVNALPKMLKGSVHAQWVKCGKPACHCSRGELHGPYFYLFHRENERLRKTYVKRSELPWVLSSVLTHRLQRRRAKDAWRLLRATREFLRDVESSIPEEVSRSD